MVSPIILLGLVAPLWSSMTANAAALAAGTCDGDVVRFDEYPSSNDCGIHLDPTHKGVNVSQAYQCLPFDVAIKSIEPTCVDTDSGAPKYSILLYTDTAADKNCTGSHVLAGSVNNCRGIDDPDKSKPYLSYMVVNAGTGLF